MSGKNHTSIISESSQPKELTFTNARIQIMQHWMLTVDVLQTLQKLDTPRCYHCIQVCIVSSSTDKIHIVPRTLKMCETAHIYIYTPKHFTYLTRSADSVDYFKPRLSSTFGERSFSYAGPHEAPDLSPLCSDINIF